MAVIPSPRTWLAGATVTAAQLNKEIRDAINFLVGPPLTVLRQVGADPIANNVQTAIDWQVSDIDRDGGWNFQQGTRYTAQTNGWHALTASVGLSPDPDGLRYVGFRVTDQFTVSGTRNGAPPTGDWVGTAAATIHLDVGEWVEVMAQHTAGATLNTVPGLTRFTIQWVSF